MMEDKKIPHTPPPPALKPEPDKVPVPVLPQMEKQKPKDKTAEFRKGMASLVGCENVPDFGERVLAKIMAYREKLRQKRTKEAQKEIRAKVEAHREAYRTGKKIKAPVLKKYQEQPDMCIRNWCRQNQKKAA